MALSVGEDTTVADGTFTYDVRTTPRLSGSEEVTLAEPGLESQKKDAGHNASWSIAGNEIGATTLDLDRPFAEIRATLDSIALIGIHA